MDLRKILPKKKEKIIFSLFMALFDRFYLIAVWAPNIYFFPVSVLSERRQTSSPTGKTVMQVRFTDVLERSYTSGITTVPGGVGAREQGGKHELGYKDMRVVDNTGRILLLGEAERKGLWRP